MGAHQISVFGIIMRWAEGRQMWIMLRACNGKTIQEFENCENIFRAFPGLRQDADNFYNLTIRRLEKGGATWRTSVLKRLWRWF